MEALAAMELKDGDWQVQVHVIEARQLKAENMDGTSDPVVYVKLGDQSQHTAIMKGTTSAVFDHHMFFNFPKLTRAEVEALTIDVSVFDANILLSSELIGKFVFDAVDVYYQPHHCYHRRWVGLVDPTNGKDRGLQGYLRLSVSVLGPGDKLYVPGDGEADSVAAASAGGAKDGGVRAVGRRAVRARRRCTARRRPPWS
ncbi:MAG: hypothetical protein M9929_05760 [Burkholderiaceae bacterium]|nr:hypothetical protein [Burkholderiaceae bacterium]